MTNVTLTKRDFNQTLPEPVMQTKYVSTPKMWGCKPDAPGQTPRRWPVYASRNLNPNIYIVNNVYQEALC